MLAHNGEINTLKGNVNWMKSHETRHGARRASAAHIEDIKPIIQPGGSDTAALDNVFEAAGPRRPRRCRWPRPMLIPEASARTADDAGRRTATCSTTATR